MTLLEFETLLDDDIIHLPSEIAAQLAKGAAIRVSITPVEPHLMTPDEAWASIQAFVETRAARQPHTSPYQWRREDAYDHLS
ncbi:MAG: hypothetical protein K8L97_01940 [Anaerolineae bacterium]|nr:hypothetical protein [Anaerolineae bacterium]